MVAVLSVSAYKSFAEVDCCLKAYYCCVRWVSCDDSSIALTSQVLVCKFFLSSTYKIRVCDARVIFSVWRVIRTFVHIDKLCQKWRGTVTDNNSTFFPWERNVGWKPCRVFVKQYSEQDTKKLTYRRKSVLLMYILKHTISDSKRGLVQLMDSNRLVECWWVSTKPCVSVCMLLERRGV